MPRGGARPGAGKKRGSFDRVTLEAQLAEARAKLAQHQNRETNGHRLAVEVLNDVMHVCYGLMAKHQPAALGEALAPGREPNDDKFKEYMRFTMDAAADLAPFQSAKFKSVTHSIEQPPGGTVAENPGVVRPLTGQEAYRMLRDSAELIELRPNPPAPALPKPKTARG